jgi:hypothetical protein
MVAANEMAALPLDPGHGVTWIVEEVDRAAERDPRVAAAKALVEERLGALDDVERGMFTTVLWMWLRQQILCNPFGWPPYAGALAGTPPGLRAIRIGLADGDALLRGIQESLDSVLTSEVVENVTGRTRAVADADPRRGDTLATLQDELRGGTDADVTPHGPVAIGLAVAAGVAIGWGAAEVYHHHIAEHH